MFKCKGKALNDNYYTKYPCTITYNFITMIILFHDQIYRYYSVRAIPETTVPYPRMNKFIVFFFKWRS